MTWPLLLGMAALLACAVVAAPLELTDTAGKPVKISIASGKVTVVVFISTLCPISNAYHDRYRAMVSVYKDQPVQFVFVNSNDNETLAEMRDHVRDAQLPLNAVHGEYPHHADGNDEHADADPVGPKQGVIHSAQGF